MKELSIEEKARRYDEAIINGSRLWECGDITRENYEYIFPGLKESEDERIRKELLEHCKNQAKPYIQTGNKCPQIQSWIAWLERQGEYKSLWHNEDEEPQRGSLILLIMQSGNPIVAKIIEPNHSFNHGERWAYIDDLLEKQGEQNPIMNVPSREIILSVWDLGNEWKELTSGSISIEYGTQLDYIQKHWHESEYYLRAIQDKQKPTDKVEPKFKIGDRITEKAFDECGCGTIRAIKDGKYIFDDGSFIYIEEQDLWKLVEQKPIDKVEPKFHEGEWITNCKCTWKIDSIDEDMYYNNHCGIDCGGDIKSIDEEYHLWTIQNAKDGDVLVCGDNPEDNHIEIIMLFKSLRNIHWASTHFHMYNDGDYRVDDWCDCGENAHPATKEQRDALFARMKDAGYEWNIEKKELKKIEQNHTWGEDDEKIIKDIIYFLDTAKKHYASTVELDACIDWLKSLKTKYNQIKIK